MLSGDFIIQSTHLSSIALKAKESPDDFKNEGGEIDELSIITRSLNKM